MQGLHPYCRLLSHRDTSLVLPPFMSIRLFPIPRKFSWLPLRPARQSKATSSSNPSSESPSDARDVEEESLRSQKNRKESLRSRKNRMQMNGESPDSPPPLVVVETLCAEESSRSQKNRMQMNGEPPDSPPPLVVVKTLYESEIFARILLFLVPVCWGTYGPAIRYIYEQQDSPAPSVLTFGRKVVSLFFFFCLLPLETSFCRPPEPLDPPRQELLRSDDCENLSASKTDAASVSTSNQLSTFFRNAVGMEWTAAIELGLWTFLGTACQTDGLENTTATRSGILLQTVTVLVPMLSAFSGVKVRFTTWFAAILALFGVTFMTLQLPDDAVTHFSLLTMLSNLGMSQGDLETLFAAFFYALCTVRLGVYALEAQAVQLSTNTMVVSTILAASWVLSEFVNIFFEEGGFNMALQPLQSPSVLSAIIFSALVPGTLASLGQTIGQKIVPAAEAQMYFSLQPFWSAVFAAIVLQEDINSSTWVAGMLVAIAAFLASYDTLSAEKK